MHTALSFLAITKSGIKRGRSKPNGPKSTPKVRGCWICPPIWPLCLATRISRNTIDATVETIYADCERLSGPAVNIVAAACHTEKGRSLIACIFSSLPICEPFRLTLHIPSRTPVSGICLNECNSRDRRNCRPEIEKHRFGCWQCETLGKQDRFRAAAGPLSCSKFSPAGPIYATGIAKLRCSDMIVWDHSVSISSAALPRTMCSP